MNLLAHPDLAMVMITADNDNDSQDASSSEDDSESQEEADETEQTNPLLQQIRQSVSSALSATGMAVP